MTRAAIYARFSSDRQNERSIDDQIALCRGICGQSGLTVISVFEDRAISGAAAVNRPGFQAMMQAARRGGFDVLVAEDVDRIARDQADYHAARKQLEFAGIAIRTAQGVVTRIDGSLRALMGEMFIENLALHTRRGMEGAVRAGRHAGGRAYGYRSVPGKPGELEIAADEAAVVRRIFADYVAGISPRRIAAALNAEGVPPPRGRRWNASTINGNAMRGSGIILNEIYAGRIVWNKIRMIKDPATGRRLSRPNPKEQHRSVDAPHLRLVSAALFEAAQERKRASLPAHMPGARKPRRFLSGLIRCGACGGGMATIGVDRKGPRLQCSTYRESGACRNRSMAYRETVERLVLDQLRATLGDRQFLRTFIAKFNAEFTRLASGRAAIRARLEKRKDEIERELQRGTDALLKGLAPAETVGPRLRTLEAERADVAREIAAVESSGRAVLYPKALDAYEVSLRELSEALKTGAETGDLIAIARQFIHRVTVQPRRGGEPLTIDVVTQLDALTERAFPKGSDSIVPVVAGDRYRRNHTHAGAIFCAFRLSA